jgi:hypothetical protein
MSSSKATHYFEAALYNTGDAKQAVLFTAHIVVSEVSSALEAGVDLYILYELATEWGIKKQYLPRKTNDVTEWRTQILHDPEGVLDIPNSKCIEQHLPKHRRPTVEEIREALRACRE